LRCAPGRPARLPLGAMTTLAPRPSPSAASQRRALNVVLTVGLADALLLVVLMYVAFVDRSDTAVSILGPVHGIGFLILLYLTVTGASAKRWGWWFPGIVLITGGPLGSIVGDIVLRRRLPDGT
jgi:integral membrane protein